MTDADLLQLKAALDQLDYDLDVIASALFELWLEMLDEHPCQAIRVWGWA